MKISKQLPERAEQMRLSVGKVVRRTERPDKGLCAPKVGAGHHRKKVVFYLEGYSKVRERDDHVRRVGIDNNGSPERIESSA